MRSLTLNNKSRWLTVLPIIKRSFALFFILDIIWRWYAHLMIAQLQDPPLHYTQYNPTFHLYQISGLQELIVANAAIARIFDVLLLISFILILIRPRNRYFNYTGFALFFIYAIISNVNLAFPAHYLSGMLMASSIFLFGRESSFSFSIQGLRYYVLWVYASAFLWKIINGALFSWETGTAVLQSNLAQYLYLNPASAASTFYYWVLRNPLLVNLMAILTYLLEGIFIIGFFTKRFDYLLMLLILSIHFGLYLAVDTLFVEWYIFILLLIPISKWESWSQRFPFLNSP